MKVQPPDSWKEPGNHLLTLLSHPWYKHLSQLLSCLISSTHHFYEEQGISPLLFPITTGSISSPMGMGSDSLPVRVQIKEHDVFLADSMQFCLELGVRLFDGGVYYILPSFRGEDVDSRHLNEFFHSEAEIRGDLNDVMLLVEKYIRKIVKDLIDHCSDDVAILAGDINHLLSFLAKETAFPRIRYCSAVETLAHNQAFLSWSEAGYPQISPLGERELIKIHGDFIWLTNMPWASVPFYQAQDGDTDYALNADLLAGIGEIIGCGQRTLSENDLVRSMAFHKVSQETYRWYLEMRNLQPVQTSGFGLGLERLLLWITKTTDIRNCMLLIRDHSLVVAP